MINKKVESFLEKNNMNYMFCLLSNLEIQRVNGLPPYIKQKFDKKITEIAMEHVAQNDIPDYMMDIEEARAEMIRLGISPEEFETGIHKPRYDDEEDYEPETDTEEFQEDYKPVYKDDSFDDDFEEEENGDSEEEE